MSIKKTLVLLLAFTFVSGILLFPGTASAAPISGPVTWSQFPPSPSPRVAGFEELDIRRPGTPDVYFPPVSQMYISDSVIAYPYNGRWYHHPDSAPTVLKGIFHNQPNSDLAAVQFKINNGGWVDGSQTTISRSIEFHHSIAYLNEGWHAWQVRSKTTPTVISPAATFYLDRSSPVGSSNYEILSDGRVKFTINLSQEPYSAPVGVKLSKIVDGREVTGTGQSEYAWHWYTTPDVVTITTPDAIPQGGSLSFRLTLRDVVNNDTVINSTVNRPSAPITPVFSDFSGNFVPKRNGADIPLPTASTVFGGLSDDLRDRLAASAASPDSLVPVASAQSGSVLYSTPEDWPARLKFTVAPVPVSCTVDGAPATHLGNGVFEANVVNRYSYSGGYENSVNFASHQANCLFTNGQSGSQTYDLVILPKTTGVAVAIYYQNADGSRGSRIVSPEADLFRVTATGMIDNSGSSVPLNSNGLYLAGAVRWYPYNLAVYAPDTFTPPVIDIPNQIAGFNCSGNYNQCWGIIATLAGAPAADTLAPAVSSSDESTDTHIGLFEPVEILPVVNPPVITPSNPSLQGLSPASLCPNGFATVTWTGENLPASCVASVSQSSPPVTGWTNGASLPNLSSTDGRAVISAPVSVAADTTFRLGISCGTNPEAEIRTDSPRAPELRLLSSTNALCAPPPPASRSRLDGLQVMDRAGRTRVAIVTGQEVQARWSGSNLRSCTFASSRPISNFPAGPFSGSSYTTSFFRPLAPGASGPEYDTYQFTVECVGNDGLRHDAQVSMNVYRKLAVNLGGVVRDNAGNPVGGAVVSIRDKVNSSRVQTVSTNSSSGAFSSSGFFTKGSLVNISLPSLPSGFAAVTADPGQVRVFGSNYDFQVLGLDCSDPTYDFEPSCRDWLDAIGVSDTLNPSLHDLSRDDRFDFILSRVVSPTCQDVSALNYGGPLPCQYPPSISTCQDVSALNYGGPLPCQYPPPPPPLPLTASCSVSPTEGVDVGETVQVSGSAAGGVAPYSYGWVLPDNSRRSGQSFSYQTALSGINTFALTVTDSVGTVQRAGCSVAVSTPPPNQAVITVDLSADPLNLSTPGFTTLRWTSNLTSGSCVASGSWSGNNFPANSGSSGVTQTVSQGDNIFRLTCTGTSAPGQVPGTGFDEVTVRVSNPPPSESNSFQVDLTADPTIVYPPGGSSTLSWSASRARDCSIESVNQRYRIGGEFNPYIYSIPSWRVISGSITVNNMLQSEEFLLRCVDRQGRFATDRVFVTVSNTPPPPPPPVPLPSITFYANPNSFYLQNDPFLNATTLFWSTQNAQTCSASANPANSGWQGGKFVSGSERVDSINNDTTFTLTCSGPGGTSVARTGVVVIPPVAPPVCGNSVVESGEQCDDGNTLNGDGCSAACQLEGGGGSAPVCGNSVVESGEQCDDGNTLNGDGCSAACQNEIVVPPVLSCSLEGAGLKNVIYGAAVDLKQFVVCASLPDDQLELRVRLGEQLISDWGDGIIIPSLTGDYDLFIRAASNGTQFGNSIRVRINVFRPEVEEVAP